MKATLRQTKQGGFSLLEIILVVLLIGILSALAVPKFVDLTRAATSDSVKAILSGGQMAVAHDYSVQMVATGKYVSPFPKLFAKCEEAEYVDNEECDERLDRVREDGNHEDDVVILHQMMGWTPNYPPGFEWHVMWMGSVKRLPVFGAEVDWLNGGEFIQAGDV